MSPTSSAVARWLAVGRDVLLTGDVGSGKTWALSEVARTAAHRDDYTVLSIRAQHTSRPFGPLLAHAAAPRGELTERAWVAWMRDELSGRRSLLLVDDLDHVDAATVAVVRTFLGSVETRLVASAGTDVRTLYRSSAALLVAERAPAQVRVEAMGLSETARLLGGALGGPASIGVVSAVATRSAGNPRVALALADAARVSGVLRVDDGVWIKSGTMETMSAESVAHGLLPHVPADQVEGLVVLAEHGTLDERAATDLVGGAVLAALVRRGRVVVHRSAGGHDLVAVSPPALGGALRGGVFGPRVDGMPERGPSTVVDEAVADGTVETGASGEPVVVEVRTSGMPKAADEYARWAAEIAVLVHARSLDKLAALWTTWQLSPTLVHANDLLWSLLRNPADTVEVERVRAATTVASTDTAADQELFDMLITRWEVWNGREPSVRLAGRNMPVAMRKIQEGVQEALRTVEDDDEVLAATSVAMSAIPLADWMSVLQASALLEAGRPDLALTVCERYEGSAESPDRVHYLDGIEAESLLMLGRFDEAEHLAGSALEQALRDLDGLGIRVHAYTLAAILGSRGRAEDAWRTLSVSLRLGSPGPHENTFYRRSLTLGTLLRSRVGDLVLTRALATELARTPEGYRPLLRSMGVLARDAVEQTATSHEELWTEGVGYAEAGLLQPALWCWLSHPGPHSPERVRTLRETYDRSRLVVLDSLVRLHEALTAGDLDALAELVGSPATIVNAAPRRTAVRMLGRGVEDDSRSLESPGPTSSLLTSRERQIALLARDGLSNKEIATEFTLSVRTVENHMSSLLRKLGFTNRQELTLHMLV